jgi:SAM-dependent methyltransferase
MNSNTSKTDERVLDMQREQWQTTFASRAEMFGVEPSYAAQRAAALFQREGKLRILELGSGQGRDTLFFLRNGFEICAVDYSEKGLEDLRDKAERLGVTRVIQTVRHDVRRPLPFGANAFDACFSHMLYCMALTTAELETLSEEIRRVLKPGGLNLYTARNTHDPDYGAGIHRCEDMYEDEGFIVHYFSRDKVERLALGYQVLEIEEFEESKLPKRLYLVTLRKPENDRTERSAV